MNVQMEIIPQEIIECYHSFTMAKYTVQPDTTLNNLQQVSKKSLSVRVYNPTKNSPVLFKHKLCPITIKLEVDIFRTKYIIK